MNSLKRYARVAQAAKPLQVPSRRQSLRPFFFSMGPVALCVTSTVLIALMAVLYLSQVGQSVAANQALQEARNAQAKLTRQNQDLVDTIAREQSPGYIAEQAKKQGLNPADPATVHVLIVPGSEPLKRIDAQVQP